VERQATLERSRRTETYRDECAAMMIKKVQGFTIIEMMVAMTLGLLVIGGVTAVLVSSSSIYKSAESRGRIQENARFSLGVLQEDVRMSGFMGCFNHNMSRTRYKSLLKDPLSLMNNYAARISGYEATGATFSPALDNEIGKAGVKPIAGNDVLVVRVPVGKSHPLAAPMANDAEPIPLANVEGFTTNGLAVISDCNFATLFRVTNVPADKRLVHAASGNTQASLGRVYMVDDNAVVTPVSTVSYFVGPSSDGDADNKSLYRQMGTSDPEEIADGIEQMQIEYGVAATLTTTSAARFVAADQVAGMPVAAIRVNMLVKSNEANAVKKKQTFLYNGASVTATDKRMYTPFTTTISLRNQVN
jgi:type IV pilus assembly protein PilW